MLPTTLLADPSVLPPTRRSVRRAPRAAAGAAAGARAAGAVRPLRAIAIAVTLLVVGGLGFLQAWPPLATVMSASMAPTINTGDMVVLERLRRPARIGDVVVETVPDDARSRYGYPPVVIHRVFTIAPDGTVRTKGDARPDPDPFTVPRTALSTRVIGHIPAGGRALAFFHSAPGLIWLISGGVLFLALPLLERQRDARRRDSDDLRIQLESVTSELTRLREAAQPDPTALAAVIERAVTDALSAAAPTTIEVPAQPAASAEAEAAPAIVEDHPAPSPAEPPAFPASPTPEAVPARLPNATPAPAAGPWPAATRWDAPPAGSAATGWAAPPSPTGRLRREPSRFIAAIAASHAGTAVGRQASSGAN